MFERFRVPEIATSFPVLAPQVPLPFSAAWHREQLGQIEPPPSTVNLVALLRAVVADSVARRCLAPLLAEVAALHGDLATLHARLVSAGVSADPMRAQIGVAPARARDAKPIPVAIEPDDLVDAKWVAQRCRVSPSTANKWMREICGRTVGTGRVLRVTLGEFERFWERRQRKGCRRGKVQ